MPVTAPATLLLCYGNPARGDDGLGPALGELAIQAGLDGLRVDIDFQLSVEHALDVARSDRVIFADARLPSSAPFTFDRTDPEAVETLGSHSVSPNAVIRLARDLYGRDVPGFVLGISGEVFGDISEGLSPLAQANLAQAFAFLQRFLAGRASDPAILENPAGCHA